MTDGYSDAKMTILNGLSPQNNNGFSDKNLFNYQLASYKKTYVLAAIDRICFGISVDYRT